MNTDNPFEEIVPIVVDSLDDLDFPTWKNIVVVKPLVDNDKTVGGILTSENIRAWSYSAHANRRAVVVSVPKSLSVDLRSQMHECEMDLKPGDMVYHTSLDGMEAIQILCDGELYKAISYSSFVLAKRGDDILMLNGYLLVEEEVKENKFLSFTSVDRNEGRSKPVDAVICYIGKRNSRYLIDEGNTRRKRFDSEENLNVGDRVYIPEAKRMWKLEEYAYAVFDNRKEYRVIQRHQIGAVY